MNSNSCYVANVNPLTTQPALLAAFKRKCPDVINATLSVDGSGSPMDFAIVTFGSNLAARRSADLMTGQVVDGHKLTVSVIPDD